jgi:hypothetical protein
MPDHFHEKPNPASQPARVGEARVEPRRAEPGPVEPSRAEPRRVEPGRVAPDWAEASGEAYVAEPRLMRPDDELDNINRAPAQVSRELRQIAGQLTRSIQQLAAQLDRVLELADKVEAERAGKVRLRASPTMAALEEMHAAQDLDVARLAEGLERDVSNVVIQNARAAEAISKDTFEALASQIKRELRDVAGRSSERVAVARRVAAMSDESDQFSPPAKSLAADAGSAELRRSYRVGELPDDILSDLRDTKMDERHSHLDHLMQE